MTQAELDALPETGRFGIVEEEIDGKIVRRPVLHDVGVLWHGDGEDAIISVLDVHGQRWMLGYGPDGVYYKRRLS